MPRSPRPRPRPAMVFALAGLLLLPSGCGGGDTATPVPDAAAPSTEATTPPAPAGPAPQDLRRAAPPVERAAPAPLPEGQAAQVNGVPISRRQVEIAVRLRMATDGTAGLLPEEEVARLRRAALEHLIDRELLYQQSAKAGVTPAPEAVEARVAAARAPYPAEEDWLAHLEGQGLNEQTFRAITQRSLAIEEYVRSEVVGDSGVTDADVRRYYEEHPEEMRFAEKIRASHILLRVPEGTSEEGRRTVRARAEDLLAEIRGGADFAALARDHSEDPSSATNGGDLGFFGRGRMVPPFEEAAFALQAGETSGVVESDFGYHIIRTTERQEGRLAPLEEISGNLRAFLEQKRSRERVEERLRSLREGATISVF